MLILVGSILVVRSSSIVIHELLGWPVCLVSELDQHDGRRHSLPGRHLRQDQTQRQSTVY